MRDTMPAADWIGDIAVSAHGVDGGGPYVAAQSSQPGVTGRGDTEWDALVDLTRQVKSLEIARKARRHLGYQPDPSDPKYTRDWELRYGKS